MNFKEFIRIYNYLHDLPLTNKPVDIRYILFLITMFLNNEIEKFTEIESVRTYKREIVKNETNVHALEEFAHACNSFKIISKFSNQFATTIDQSRL